MTYLILGGSFNPPHIAHLILADEIACEFGYDRILLVPSLQPPHKNLVDDPGPQARLAMLQAAASTDPLLHVDPCELERGGVSYTVDTLSELVVAYAMVHKPGLIIGDDLAAGFQDWQAPQRIAEMTDIIIARRTDVAVPGFGYPHRLASNSLVPVSSTLIRRRVAEGGAWRHLVPAPVAAYIIEHGLYGVANAALMQAGSW
jgi:nicotinate-nucleotide adenylyltransferase